MDDQRASQNYSDSAGRAPRAIAVAVFSLALMSCARDPTEQIAHANISGAASVVDGNTIEIEGQRINVFGYDTPRDGAHCGDTDVSEQASLALLDFIANQIVSCASYGVDANQQLTATCSVDQADLGAHMVTEGWGRDQPQSKDFFYAHEEELARAQQRGIWALQCPADVWGGGSDQSL